MTALVAETTPQGQISYGYDLAGCRASMTVAGQPQVTYSYDNANRLTQIAQGMSTVGFSYDTANRRSTLTLSNGVNISYTYDNDSRVTGITYKFNANTLGNLTYSYDSIGRRTQVGGSFAKTGLPGAITSATYDAANELTNWTGTWMLTEDKVLVHRVDLRIKSVQLRRKLSKRSSQTPIALVMSVTTNSLSVFQWTRSNMV